MTDGRTRPPRLELYLDAVGEFRWRLVAANNKIVLLPEGHPWRPL